MPRKTEIQTEETAGTNSPLRRSTRITSFNSTETVETKTGIEKLAARGKRGKKNIYLNTYLLITAVI